MTTPVRSVVVLDTSVLVKWFRSGEPLAAEASAFRQAYYEDRLNIVAPDLIPYELANALRYSSNAGQEESTRAMESLYALGIEIVPATAARIARALALAYQHDLTVYDAAFVALAEELGADFITADEKLLKKVSTLPFCHFLANVALPPPTAEEE